MYQIWTPNFQHGDLAVRSDKDSLETRSGLSRNPERSQAYKSTYLRSGTRVRQLRGLFSFFLPGCYHCLPSTFAYRGTRAVLKLHHGPLLDGDTAICRGVRLSTPGWRDDLRSQLERVAHSECLCFP